MHYLIDKYYTIVFYFNSFKYFMKRKTPYIEIREMGGEMRYRL